MRGDAARKYVNPKAYVIGLEDDALIRALLERWLGEAGYEVLPRGSPDANDGAQKTLSLVIADVPSPQGAQPLIRSLQAVYAAPILVLSARFRRGLAGSAEAARRLGVKKVLPKPFTRKELLSAVRESLEIAT